MSSSRSDTRVVFSGYNKFNAIAIQDNPSPFHREARAGGMHPPCVTECVGNGSARRAEVVGPDWQFTKAQDAETNEVQPKALASVPFSHSNHVTQ
jgi:hypothetical protein